MAAKSIDSVSCLCQRPDDGKMVKCDNPRCAIDWFHLRCAGLAEPPLEGRRWYCNDCKEKMPQTKESLRESKEGIRAEREASAASPQPQHDSPKKTESRDKRGLSDIERSSPETQGAIATSSKIIGQPPNAAFATSRTHKWPGYDVQVTEAAETSETSQDRREPHLNAAVGAWDPTSEHDSIPDTIGYDIRKDLLQEAQAKGQHVRNPGCWCGEDHVRMPVGEAGQYKVDTARYLFQI